MKAFLCVLVAAIGVVRAGLVYQRNPYQTTTPKPYNTSPYTPVYPPAPHPYHQKPTTPRYDSNNAYPPSYKAPANYSYEYQVMANDDYNSGGYGKGYDGSSYGTPAAPVNFGAEESRYGDNTRGSYFVQLPDGRIEKVNYYVNGYSGYVADVTYEPAPNAYQTPSSSYGGMPPTSTGAHRRPAPVY